MGPQIQNLSLECGLCGATVLVIPCVDFADAVLIKKTDLVTYGARYTVHMFAHHTEAIHEFMKGIN